MSRTATGSYTSAFLVSGVLCAVGAALALGAGRRPPPPARPVVPEAAVLP